MRHAILVVVLSLLAVSSAFAYPCDAIYEYHPCYFVITTYNQNGIHDGYWDCDEVVTNANLQWYDYIDGSVLYNSYTYNKYGQFISCRRYCDCPNPNDCDAKDAFNAGVMACVTE